MVKKNNLQKIQKILKRMQVWEAYLKGDNDTTTGLHPVIIIESWKRMGKVNKGKVNNILVVPITSKPPRHKIKSQLKINEYEKFGLTKVSYIMCEQMRRVNIKELKIRDVNNPKPLGSLSVDKNLVNELTKILASQVQAENNYPNWDIDNFDITRDETYESERYLKLYHKFKREFANKRYSIALKITSDIINEISDMTEYNRNQYYHKTYYNMALCYLKMDQYNECKTYAVKSLTYLPSNKITDEYASSMFLIIRCSGKDKEFCYDAYKKLYKYFKLKDDLGNKALCLFNMSNLVGNYKRCKMIYNKTIDMNLHVDIVRNMSKVLSEN